LHKGGGAYAKSCNNVIDKIIVKFAGICVGTGIGCKRIVFILITIVFSEKYFLQNSIIYIL